MTIGAELKKEYSRGYTRAALQKWSAHRPPYPPEPVIRELMESLRALRDAIDGELAKFDPDEPMNKVLDPYIQAADNAMGAVTEWLTRREPVDG